MSGLSIRGCLSRKDEQLRINNKCEYYKTFEEKLINTFE